MPLIAGGKWSQKSIGKYVLSIGLALACCLVYAPVESAVSLEYKVKAAYIFKLLKFVEWEISQERIGDNHFSICVVGRHPIGDAVRLLNTKTVKSHPITVYQKHADDKLSSCHVVFVTNSVKNKMHEILLKTDPNNNLTISDIKGFAKSGGMVELALVENKVKLLINQSMVRASKIHFSSKLMGIAVLVESVGVGARNS